MVLKLDMVQAAALAVIVLFIGQKIKNKLEFLDRYCIPAPVMALPIVKSIQPNLKYSNLFVIVLSWQNVRRQKWIMPMIIPLCTRIIS